MMTQITVLKMTNMTKDKLCCSLLKGFKVLIYEIENLDIVVQIELIVFLIYIYKYMFI